MSKQILRVGILGQGRSGHSIHYRWLREAPKQFQIVAVADQMRERVKEAKEEFGAKTYRDYRDLVKDDSLELDLVVNSLPSFLHPKGTIAALEAGCHVVCEKPAAKTVTDFDQMVETARRNKKLLLPFQNSRFQPAFKKMQDVIASGKLGKIVYIRSNWSGFARRWDWQTRQEYWGGNLLNTGPHPMDHAVLLFGNKTPNVFCRQASENPFGDADNFSMVVLYGKDAPTVEVVISSFQAYPQGETYNVCGEFGGLTGGAGGLTWKYFNPAKAPAHKFKGEWSDKRSYCGEKLKWIEKTWSPPEGELFQTLSKAFYDNAYDIIVNKAKRVIKLPEVRRQVAVLEECARQNRLPKLKERFLKGK